MLWRRLLRFRFESGQNNRHTARGSSLPAAQTLGWTGFAASIFSQRRFQLTLFGAVGDVVSVAEIDLLRTGKPGTEKVRIRRHRACSCSFLRH